MSYGDSLPADTRREGNIAVYGSNGPVGMHATANTIAPCIVVGRKGSFGKVHYSLQAVFAIDTTFYIDRRKCSSDLSWLSRILEWLRLDGVSRDSAVPGLSREDAYERRIPIPPLEEQVCIVRYLGHVDRQIRRYVRAKEKLIGLLEEEKQAIIDQAVIRGLEPSVRLKPSGVEWLGDVPEHWKLVPNRSLLRIQKEIVGYRAHEFTLLSLTKRGIIPRDMENPEGKFPASFDSYQAVEPGDLIFCLFDIDETPRAVGMSELSGMITGAYTRFVCRDELTARFVYLLYLYLDDRKLLKPLYSGLRKVITKQNFLGAKLALPPAHEQRAIVDYIDRATHATNSAITRARRQVELLEEYRTRLIADVVTGKLDVREAAAGLPDEGDDEDAIGEGRFRTVSIDEDLHDANGLA